MQISLWTFNEFFVNSMQKGISGCQTHHHQKFNLELFKINNAISRDN